MMRLAIIGTGSIGSRHLEIAQSLLPASTLAIPVRLERHVELLQMGYAVAESLKSAVAQGVTLAVIATDTHRHTLDVIEAISLGLDVLVEKPMATTAQHASEVCRVAAQLDRRVFVACVLRCSESLNIFHNYLSYIGRVHSVRIECQSYLPDWRLSHPYRDSYSARANEGGVLRDLIHEVDYAGWLFGWPKAVQARVRNLGRLGIETDEAADLFWETEGEIAVSIHLDYLSRPARRRMCACGEFGTLEWDAVANKILFSPVEGEVQEIISDQNRDQMLADQLRAFIATSEGRFDVRLATAKDGVLALAVCDAARLSSEIRQEAEVNYYGLL